MRRLPPTRLDDDEPPAYLPDRQNKVLVQLGANIRTLRVNRKLSHEALVARTRRLTPCYVAKHHDKPDLTVDILASIEAGMTRATGRQLWLIASALRVRVFEDLWAGILEYDPNW